MANWEYYITQYGCWALFFGSLAEGETLALLGGAAVHHQLLHYSQTVAAVALGGALGDVILYFIGRRFGHLLLSRFKNQVYIERTQRLIVEHPILCVIGVRFIYGFRLIGPVVIGVSQLQSSRFLPLNLLGAIIWAVLFVSVGYAGGYLLNTLLAGYSKQFYGILTVIVIIGALLASHFWCKKNKKDP